MSTALKIKRPIDILLVEDNPGDVELTREAFLDADMPSNIHVAADGEEALDFLYRRGDHKTAIRPDLILLDLNMPRKNGKEVLAVIKEDETLKDIPVIVLTSSEAEQDILKSYQLHTNAYVVKPVDLPQYLHVVAMVEEFWFGIVELPSQCKKKE